MKRMVIVILLIGFIQGQCLAQEKADMLTGSGQDMMIVLGCGLAGGVLGLSTLSFVEEPGEHLNNIIVGGAIGLIVGVAAVAWSQASKSQSSYFEQQAKSSPKFNTNNRYSWHRGAHQKSLAKAGFRAADVGYTFSF